MKSRGVEVERSTMPTHIELSTDEAELADPTSHPVKVSHFCPRQYTQFMEELQVTLERLEEPDGEPHEEIVRAKFVLGADGSESQCHRAHTKTHAYRSHRSPFVGQENVRHNHGRRTDW